MKEVHDTTFNVYSDTPTGRDPDSYSPGLKRFHEVCWSKPLPDGTLFHLSAGRPGTYLHHRSHRGEFFLSSDSIGHTYRHVRSMNFIISEIAEEELDAFFKLCSTFGAYVLFPSNRIEKKNTINGARGMHHRIKDRFDLTLECIRRHYFGEESPLSDVLARYADFFALFESFDGYVNYFLLDDIIDHQGRVAFFWPFIGFDSPPLPADVGEYLCYRLGLSAFVSARNRRISQSVMT